ncbi:MAG: hypothetical protein U9R42_09265 [Bacteroidota bacterium]|nr:hypothetical protein [Bacteroidota bacterium]
MPKVLRVPKVPIVKRDGQINKSANQQISKSANQQISKSANQQISKSTNSIPQVAVQKCFVG